MAAAPPAHVTTAARDLSPASTRRSPARPAAAERQRYGQLQRLQTLAGNAAVTGLVGPPSVQRSGEGCASGSCGCASCEGEREQAPAGVQRLVAEGLGPDTAIVVQREKKKGADVFTDPPSSGMTASFDGLRFEPAAEAVFLPGDKQPQCIAIVARRLAGGSYTAAIGRSLAAWAAKNRFVAFGAFQAGASGPGGDAIGGMRIALLTSLQIIGFLRDKKVKVEITPQQEEILALGRTTFDMAADIRNEAKKRGEKLPAWYPLELFQQEMAQHGALLRTYRDSLDAHRRGEEGALDKGLDAVRQVYDSITGPTRALEAIRTDRALPADPETKEAWEALWGTVGAAVPTTLENPSLAQLFLSWCRSQPDSVKAAPGDAAARSRLLQRFFSFGHDVTFTPMAGDQAIRDVPATANALPFDATLSSSPVLQPPLFDAALGTDHRFTMKVQFPDVTDALATWAYNWERVTVPESSIGEPVDPATLKGDKPTAGEVANVRFGRATAYARADIERATKDMMSDLGPTGVGATSLVAANAMLRYIGTGIRLGLELLAMPENQKPVVFPGPGLYLVRCAASPVFKGETPIRRAPSVAYLPVLARDPDEMALGSLEGTLKGEQATRDRIVELEKALADPGPPEVKRELQKELDTLKVAVGPTGGILGARRKELDELIADIKAGKSQGSLADAEKQREQLDKIIALRARRKVGDSAERLAATFVSDTGQRMALSLEAVDKPKVGGHHVAYVSDTTTSKSGAETGHGPTRAAAVEKAVRKILEGTAGYGRGRVAVRVGAETRTLRIEASLGSLLMESIENVATVASLAAVAAAPLTGGASLTLLIPIGIVGAVPSAYRIAKRVEHGTFELDLESAMDVVNVLGSAIGLGRLGATSLRAVRLGRAMLFMGFGADGLGGLLLGADLVVKIEELSKLPEGERAAALLLLVSQVMLQAGIVAGGALAERAHQRRAEAKAKGRATKAGDELFTKAQADRDLAVLGAMNDETKGLLKGNEPLRTALVDNPSAASALKKCASPCFPPGASPQQVQRLERLLNRLKETGAYDEAALKQYFHKRRDDLTAAIANLDGVKTAGDLNAWLKFYNEGRGVITLPAKGDPRELAARMARAHDIGVSKGREMATSVEGLTAVGFDNPIKGGTFGQGFDDVMRKGVSLDVGEVFIVEYKGGTSVLQPGQMGVDWVVGNIRRLYTEGGPKGQAWARVLSKALREGRLRGVAYSTPILGNAPQPTKVVQRWNYEKRNIPLP
jgi:hypothetical protein